MKPIDSPLTASQASVTEWISTPWQSQGLPVILELLVRKPQGNGPFPTVIFNHGSTGNGRNRSAFSRTVESADITAFFTQRGWMVLYPQRRGRGRSGGEYLEGMSAQRLGYSCKPDEALAGLDRAIEDLDVVMNHVRIREDVMQDRLIVAGASRGGALAVAWAGDRAGLTASQPSNEIAGVISFSGGWLGQSCKATYSAVNQAVFNRGANFTQPMLWLQGSTDAYYSVAHCRESFDRFRASGGQGAFYVLPAGHNLVSRSSLWADLVEHYLQSLGVDS